MRLEQDNGERLDRSILAFLVGVFLFLSPFTLWWAGIASLWYLPYLMWVGLIALIAWVVQRSHDDV
jgi:hypothetical protein